MTTIDDKLKLFAKVVFEKAEKDSQQKVIDVTKKYDKYLEDEKANILRESEMTVKQMKKKAESKREQIISKANIDSQHMLLKKRKELFDRTVEDIKEMAKSFRNSEQYLAFLEKSIEKGLSKINSMDIVMFFDKEDLKDKMDSIRDMADKYKKPGMVVEIAESDRDIVGGCIIEDKGRTIRVDCSFSSIIDDNRILIGKMLMDNLE